MKQILLFFIFSIAYQTNTFSQIENKTVCIKHPDAENLENFLKSNTTIFFEFKGDKLQSEKFIENLKRSNQIKSCNKGKVTGDFHGIQIIFKNTLTKPEFFELIKNAGATYIKINNSELQKL
jgi:allophanate hydrolase subunit 1